MLSKTAVNRTTLHCVPVIKSIENHIKKILAIGFVLANHV